MASLRINSPNSVVLDHHAKAWRHAQACNSSDDSLLLFVKLPCQLLLEHHHFQFFFNQIIDFCLKYHHHQPLLEASLSSRISLLSHQLCYPLRLHTHHAFDASLHVRHARTSSPECHSCTYVQHGSICNQRKTRCTTRLDEDVVSCRLSNHQPSNCSETGNLRRPHQDRHGSL